MVSPNPVRLVRFVCVALLVLATACLDQPQSEDELDAVAHGGPVISTNASTYTPGQSITVSWMGMPGNQMDWVAITTAGSPPNSGFQRFAFINGQVAGSQVFAGLPIGNYEARAYVNNTYQIVATSTFTVGAATAVTITTDRPTYGANPTVQLTWTNMPGNMLDWVSINVAGSAANAGFVKYAFINGAVNGSISFSGGIGPGNYEARAYRNNTYQILATKTFTVTAATISTNKSAYSTGETVAVTFGGMPGNANDFIAISTAGAAANSIITSQSTMGQVSGTRNFTNLPVGNYEARAYLGGTFQILASRTFSVTGAMVSTNATSYTQGQSVVVNWSGLPGSMTDWIAIYPSGSPDNGTATMWVYTMGQTSGSKQFAGVPPGSYEARAYLNNTFVVAARSATFTVAFSNACTSAPVRPVFSGITSGNLVIGATQQVNTAAVSVPLDRSILFTSVRENEISPAFGGVMCELTATGVTCTRNNPGTDAPGSDGTITVHWSVVTFTSGVTVQRGLANLGFTNPTVATLTAVDPNQSFVLVGGGFNSGTGWGNNEFIRAQLTSGTSLELRTNTMGTQMSWQVVSMVGATVQRGSATLASADTVASVPITFVPSGTFALASYTTDNASGIEAAAMLMQTRLSSTTALELRRSLGGSNLDVSWEVVSLPFATRVGTTTFTAGQTSRTEGVSGIAAASSIAIAGSQGINGQSGGSTTYAGASLDLVGEGLASLTTVANGVTVQRGTSQAGATIPWTVLDFAHDCTGF